jgi:hypothetical protein
MLPKKFESDAQIGSITTISKPTHKIIFEIGTIIKPVTKNTIGKL